MKKNDDDTELFRKFKIFCSSITILALLALFSLPEIVKTKNMIYNKINYTSDMDLYNKLINDIKEIFQKLNITDPMEIFVFYINLYTSGTISNSIGFEYYNNNEEAKEIPGCLGMNVVKGIGFCRHISTFLDDLFKAMGYESYIISNHYGYEEKTIEYDKVNVYSRQCDDNFFNTFDSNHACNLVFYKDKVYIFDATNKIVFQYSRYGKLNIINGEGTSYSKVFLSYYRSHASVFECARINNILNNYSSLSKDEVMEKIKLYLKEYNECVNEFRYNMDEKSTEELKKRLILIDRS